MAWGPLSLITSLVIRNCKHYGFPALAVHGLLGQVILWSSVFSILDKSHLGEFFGLKGYIGIMNLVTLGLIEATAITMSMLKMLHINFNVKCFKFIQLTHMVRQCHLVPWYSGSIYKRDCDVDWFGLGQSFRSY